VQSGLFANWPGGNVLQGAVVHLLRILSFPSLGSDSSKSLADDAKV
jgi:hypothetical protein